MKKAMLRQKGTAMLLAPGMLAMTADCGEEPIHFDALDASGMLRQALAWANGAD